jgi:hypothetical protein
MVVQDTWTVVQVTAAKFKRLLFSVCCFALSNIAYIFIFVIMNDFCLSSAQVLLWNRNGTWKATRISRKPWKVASSVDYPIVHSLQFQQMGFCRKFSGGTT